MERQSDSQSLEDLLGVLSLAEREWVKGMLQELLVDMQADRILQEGLGDGYTPMNPRNWRPSAPPPGMDWPEYERLLAEC